MGLLDRGVVMLDGIRHNGINCVLFFSAMVYLTVSVFQPDEVNCQARLSENWIIGFCVV